MWMLQPLLATGSAHVASGLTKSGTSLDADWPHWQMSVVHRVIGGPVRRSGTRTASKNWSSTSKMRRASGEC
jgi:hypothetical protein